MKVDFDAIAIGGGLAGSTFALTLAREGAKVAVIERTPAAQLKVCGDFLSVEAQKYLENIGIDIRARGAKAIRTLRMTTGRWAASTGLPFNAAGFSRLTLDEMLLDAAQGAGVEIIRGQRVRELEADDRQISIKLGGQKLHASSVALATGKHNLKNIKRVDGGPTAFKMSFVLQPAAHRALDDVVQLVSYDGGYAGTCNIEGDAATVCWLADATMMKRTRGKWGRQLKEIGAKSPHFQNLLAEATPLHGKPATVSAVPYGYKRIVEIHPRVLPLGDQLAVIPSFTGDGTSLAMASGILAAEAVLQGQTAANFQRAFHARIHRQFFWARAVDMSFKTRPTRLLSVGAVAAVPGLATALARFTRFPEPI